MCLGIPHRLASVQGILGLTETGEAIDLTLTPEALPGDWLLTFLGTSREVITEAQAALIADALQGLADIMAGGTGAAAFADLDRPPELPPHLQAALAAGQETA
ncbi:HypC/HybG/HupF family hydrogenase formation chaperone [Stagnihabitans tardus]|uniref:HypC/HybG/HupF family hydrogenase formation chaperone n=1 Tax=Stagnihabitans tardus TaxID=2699202 RepID=A0AAE4YAE3_9RHOB|nr:HypC/HybG/HupF family hydrogenase formation chaperone [Stagnihabitans tardus]NBZ88269.1 HypC/HybG/HupF family hydrogenase formation chaperone [Stagnihabitans tardus]